MKDTKFRYLAVITLLGLMCFSGQAAPMNVVGNPGFEVFDFGGWVSPWAFSTTAGFSFFTVSGTAPHTGSNAADFGAFDCCDTLSQTLTTSPGLNYNVSFWLMADAAGTFQALWNGTPIQTAPQQAFVYGEFGGTVQGTGLDTLAFTGFNASGYFHLDDVSVAAIPEPATFGLLALVLLAVPAVARWRRRRN